MFGWKKVIDRLDKIEVMLGRLANLVNTDERLAEQNERLMDRLMSKDYPDYASHSPDVLNKIEGTGIVMDTTPLTDEGNIGEILTDEEIG